MWKKLAPLRFPLLSLLLSLGLSAKEGPPLLPAEVPLPPSLEMPWTLAVTPEGHLLVADRKSSQVLDFAPDGLSPAPLTWKDPSIHSPLFLATDEKTIAVADGNSHIVFFDSHTRKEVGSFEETYQLNAGTGFLLWGDRILFTGKSFHGCSEPAAPCMHTLVSLKKDGSAPLFHETERPRREDLPPLFAFSVGHAAKMGDGRLFVARSFPAELRLYNGRLERLRTRSFSKEIPPFPQEALRDSSQIDRLSRKILQIRGAGNVGQNLWALFQIPGPSEPLLEVRLFSPEFEELVTYPLLLSGGFPPRRYLRAAQMTPSGELFFIVQDADRDGPGRTRLWKAVVPAFPPPSKAPADAKVGTGIP